MKPHSLSWRSVVACFLVLGGSWNLPAQSETRTGPSPEQMPVSLAVGESFEAPEYQTGQLGEKKTGWKAMSVEGAAPSAPVISDEQAAFGAQSLKVMPGGGVIHPLASSTLRFVDFHLLPAFAEEPDIQLKVAGAHLGFVRNGTTGEVVVFNSEGDGEVMASYPLEEGNLAEAWTQFTLRIDSGKRQWDLYLDGKPARDNLPLAGTDTSFELKGASAGDIYLDGFVEAEENPLFADRDRDGLPDAEEKAFGLDPNLNDRDGDLDRDGIKNVEEFFADSSLRASGIGEGVFVFVDNLNGSDANTGKTSQPGMGANGPKASIKAAMEAAAGGDTIVVMKGRGIYDEGSRGAPGKQLTIKAVSQVTIK